MIDRIQDGMKVLPTRAERRAPAAMPPDAGAGTASRAAGAASVALDGGVAAVALSGLVLAFAIGTAEFGPEPLALYVALAAPLALAAAVAAGRRAAGRDLRWTHGAALAVLLAVGAVLRFRGLGFALPYVPHPDEPAVVNIAQRMLVTGDLNPHRFVYPSLYIYLQALAYLPHLLWGFAQGTYTAVGDLPATTDRITTAPGIYLWGRALTAALGTAAIALTYDAGRRLYGPRVALVAALLVAFTPALVDDAHLITVDVPAATFTILAFALIARLYRAPLAPDRACRWGPVLAAGAGVGLAAATKYNAALIAAPLLLVPLLRGARAPWRVWLGGGLAALGTFFLVTPFAIPDLPRFLNDTASVVTHYRFTGHARFEGDANWRYYAAYLWDNGQAAFLLALGGLLLLAFRHRRADLLVLPFPLLYYAALADLKVNFTRNLMPLYPFLALAGAVGLLAAARRGAALAARVPRLAPGPAVLRPALAAVLCLPLVVASPAAIAGQLDNLRARPDSRVVAQRWMDGHLPRGLYWLAQTPPQQWTRHPHVASTEIFGPPHRRPLDWYAAHGFRYLLLSRGEYGPYLANPGRYPAEAAWYADALARFTTVRVFPGGGSGPDLTLLDTGAAPAALALQQRPDARFGAGEIALRGYTVSPLAGAEAALPAVPDAAARPFRPGDTLGIALLWQPLRQPAGDYQLFVHLRDAGGRTVAQRDTRPRHGAYPTDRWSPDQPVLDSANLPLPAALPPGRYTIVLGFYPPGRPRLPARAAPDAAPLPDDELPLATIEVGR